MPKKNKNYSKGENNNYLKDGNKSDGLFIKEEKKNKVDEQNKKYDDEINYKKEDNNFKKSHYQKNHKYNKNHCYFIDDDYYYTNRNFHSNKNYNKYKNYQFQDYMNNSNNKISINKKSRKQRKGNLDQFTSTAQFFQHYVEHNNFSFNPNLPHNENLNRLFSHLNIKENNYQQKKLKEILEKSKLNEENKQSEKNLIDQNQIDINYGCKNKWEVDNYRREKYNQYDYYNNIDPYFLGDFQKGFEDYYDFNELDESFSENPHIEEDLANYDDLKKLNSIAEFFEFFLNNFNFKIKKKFDNPNFHLSNFYKLADFMKWRNLLSEKKHFFKNLDEESKKVYLDRNTYKFNLTYNSDLSMKRNFWNFCKFMKWEDIYNSYYELFIKLLNAELEERNKSEENKSKTEYIKEKYSLDENLIKMLNEDLIEFEKQISANLEENNKISKTVFLFEEFMIKFFPECIIKPFGSFTQNLHLKDSDVDIAVFDKPIEKIISVKDFKNKKNPYGFDSNDKKLLKLIKKNLLKTKFSSYQNTFFINAKVPIIKTKCTKTGVNLDIRYSIFIKEKNLNYF